MSKSDPMCVTYIQPFGSSEWKEYHRTEAIRDNHNPDFASKVLLPYRFEEQQPLKFELYDIDSNSRNLRDHDFLGFVVCNLGQIVSSGKVSACRSFGKAISANERCIEAIRSTYRRSYSYK